MDPYGIVFHCGRWYLAGWDHLRQAVRTFRVDRVVAAEPTGRPAARPPDFDAVSHVQRSIAEVTYTWTAEVVLDLSLEHARRRVPPTVGTLEERPDGVLLRLGTDDLDWAARYLVGLGCQFRVAVPRELDAALVRLAEDLLAGRGA